MNTIQNKPAFTLLELLVALMLFTTGIVSVIQIFPANARLITQSSNATTASFLAQEALEKMRAVPYVNLTSGTYITKSAVPTDANSSEKFVGFEQEALVEYLDENRAVAGTDQGLKRLTVTIYWSEGTRDLDLSMSTFITN